MGNLFRQSHFYSVSVHRKRLPYLYIDTHHRHIHALRIFESLQKKKKKKKKTVIHANDRLLCISAIMQTQKACDKYVRILMNQQFQTIK